MNYMIVFSQLFSIDVYSILLFVTHNERILHIYTIYLYIGKLYCI